MEGKTTLRYFFLFFVQNNSNIQSDKNLETTPYVTCLHPTVEPAGPGGGPRDARKNIRRAIVWERGTRTRIKIIK